MVGGICQDGWSVYRSMDSGFRIWVITAAIYILFIALIQFVVYLAVPRAPNNSCRGQLWSRPETNTRQYIDSYYLKRTSEGFQISSEPEFIESVISDPSSPKPICIADVHWFESNSLFHRYSLLSASYNDRGILAFSAREGSSGVYRPIDPFEHSLIQTCIGESTNSPRFIQVGLHYLVLPKFDPLNLILKLLIHSALIWYSIRLSPVVYKSVRWWLLPEPKRYSGKCVNCHYSTAGLTSPICPECGRHHGTVYSSHA